MHRIWINNIKYRIWWRENSYRSIAIPYAKR